jgi:hypothetical protein
MFLHAEIIVFLLAPVGFLLGAEDCNRTLASASLLEILEKLVELGRPLVE